ncbi:MAG TPA: prolipoprotein diacylglyceryl transferase [Erysipelothrix sp.]|nr:prolipoprotein diacylglyceryl transferase [Erysipelothrix sp.]
MTMEFFPDLQTFIRIGSLDIAWYAVLIMSGAYIAYAVSAKSLKKAGYNIADIENLFFGALITGFAGARLWYVLFYDLATSLKDPISIFMIRDGGLAIHGGLFAGVSFGYWYAKKKNLNFWHMADMVVPNILIAQAIGRWGNFMNQEAYGGIVSESFYNYFPAFIKNIMFINGEYRMPTFFFESVANIIGWLLIYFVVRKLSTRKRGDMVYAYLMWYGVTRYFIEGMRTDSLTFFHFRIAQLISLGFLFVGVLGYVGFFRRFRKPSKPVILFDFDGTLMDTEGAIKEAYRQVFRNNKPDYVLSEDDLNSFIGPSLVHSFGRFFDEDLIEDLITEYRTINHELHVPMVKPIDHAIEVLETLKEQGYTLGLVSNKARGALEVGLQQWNMNLYFDVILGVDEFETPKPDPKGVNDALELLGAQRANSIYVGDAVSDIVAGQRAGSFTIGFVFDKMREQALVEAGPNRVIHDLREILEIVGEDHEWTTDMM